MYRRFHSPGVGAGLAVAVGSLHVEGPVQVEPGGSFGDFFNADPVAIDGPLWADHNASVAIGLENRYGALVSSIAGAVRASPSTIQIHNTKVGGPVDINGGGGPNPVLAAAGVPYPGYNFNDLEDNVILGPVSETGTTGSGQASSAMLWQA